MIRSLRSIRLETRRALRFEVEHKLYLGTETSEYAAAARAAWRDACDRSAPWRDDRDPSAGANIGELRTRCIEQTLTEIRAEIAQLETTTDERYEADSAALPLSTWPLSWAELGHYARRRGIEPVEWYEHFTGFGDVRPAGMGGWGWRRIDADQRLSFKELEPILGFDFANNTSAPRFAACAQQ